jgi:type II secretory pathway pseudopilin PulG
LLIKIIGDKMKSIKSKKAQIWVETVIYTLIGLTIIGVILAIATPAIERYKDQLVVEQTLSIMNDLDNTIKDVRDAGSGNRRIIPELVVKKGRIEIDSENEEIRYIMEGTRLEYSEPGVFIEQGSMKTYTEQIGDNKNYNINISMDYSGVNVTYEGADKKKTFTSASVAYRLALTNKGTTGNMVWIDFEEI